MPIGTPWIAIAASPPLWTKSSKLPTKRRPRPEPDRSTISASGGHSRAVIWVATLQRGGGARRWRTWWRVPSTTPTLHSQRAKPSPLWSMLCPGIRIGRGMARIARILWGKAPCGAGIACPPPRTPRRGATRGGGSGGSDPLFFAAGAAPGRGRWCTPKSTTSPPLFGGRSLHSDPWREGHRALPRSGPINRSVLPLDTRRPGSRPSHP